MEPRLPSRYDVFRKSSSPSVSTQRRFQLEQYRPCHAACVGGVNRGSDANDSRWVEETVDGLRTLALDTVKNPRLSREDRIYVMQSALAFQRDRLWGRVLDHLNDGEFPASCPACRKDLYPLIGKHGIFVTSGDWVRAPSVVRTEIKPLEADTLTGIGKWLHTVSVQSHDPELADWIRYMFGTSKCPECGKPFDLPDAIAEIEEP